MPRDGFWKNVLFAWSSYNYTAAKNIDSIMNSIIWLNLDITVRGKPIMNKKCINRNIIYIKDFIGNNRQIMTFEEFRTKYGNFITFVEYYGIITVSGKSYATLIQEFFVVPPEGVEKVWTWCNTAEGVYSQSLIYKVDLSPPGI